MDNNVFQEACLIQLATPCWQGSRMLDPAVMEQIGSQDWLRGRKYLVDPDTLSPIRAVISRARKDLELRALPFPISGLTLVPKECLAKVEKSIQEHQDKFWQAVDSFIAQYEDARKKAKKNLGELFNEQDYPLNVRQKFGFSWCYFTLSTPGKYQLLTPEIYAREKQKFETMMEETRELAIAAMREEFAGHVTHIVDRLTASEDGKPKVFRDSMVEKIQDYLTMFDSRNLFNDESLTKLVAEARQIVGGVKPQWLRDNTQLQHHIREKMTVVKEEIDKAVQDMPRRKIRIAA